MLNIYNYNNIIHNKSTKIASDAITTVINKTHINYNYESWYVRFSIAQLIKNHAHLGGATNEIIETSYWFLSSRKYNFIFINMQFTLTGLRGAILAVKGTIRNYQKFAFVNNDVTSWGYTTEYANMASEPYFIYQWVGGTFTNIKKLWPMYWDMLENKTWEELTRRQCFIKMSLTGYRLMHSTPKLVFFNTLKYSVNAAAEAHAMFIGSFGLLDIDAHSVDPTVYLPSNDDSGITLSYYNSIFCKLILKEKYRMVKNFIAKKKLLRSVKKHRNFNVILRKHMRTRALLELHHAKNKWLHPVVWNTLKYARRLFSFKMFPNLWDKSIVHKIFKSFHQIKYSYFGGKGKYSRAVKEYEQKIYRFYKIYLNTLFTFNTNTLKIDSINKGLFYKYINARKFYYINLIRIYKRFGLLYKEMVFVYKWMFDLEVDWYGPAFVSIFKKYTQFLKKSQKELQKLTLYLNLYRKKLHKIRINNKNILWKAHQKYGISKQYFKLSKILKVEDTWGDQFMPTKFKVLKLPTQRKKQQKIFLFQKKKKSNPKHSLFMRQKNYKYSSKIWQLRKRPWLPIKNPIYYVKEPKFFYQEQTLKRSKLHYKTTMLKKRADLYLNNFLSEYFMALKKNKTKFNNTFLIPNNFYNIMPKRYNLYSIYLSSRFNSKLWFLLLRYMKNSKNIYIKNQLMNQFKLKTSTLIDILQPILNKHRINNEPFTINNIYINYIKQNLPLKGKPFYASRGELHIYYAQLKKMAVYTRTSENMLLTILPKNIIENFPTNELMFRSVNFFAKHHLNIWKTKIISTNLLKNLTIYLKSIFSWKLNYNYKQVMNKFSKVNRFFDRLPTINISKFNQLKGFTMFNKNINFYHTIVYNKFLLRALFFPNQQLPLMQHKFFFTLKQKWPIQKKINKFDKNISKKSFYQMWLDRNNKKHTGMQTILNQDLNFYLTKKRFISSLSNKKISQQVYNMKNYRMYSQKSHDFSNTPSLINELLTWKIYNKPNNKYKNSYRSKKANKNNLKIKNNFNIKRRNNWNYTYKKFNPRFQQKSPFYVKQQRNYLRNKRQNFFRPFFSINDRIENYIEGNLKNLLRLNVYLTTNQLYFILINLLKKLISFNLKEFKHYAYILLIFCYKLLSQLTTYSVNFILFINTIINILTNKLNLQVSAGINKFFTVIKNMHFNLIHHFKQPTKAKLMFKYKYFIDPYVKLHLWPYNYNLYGSSTFISFFWDKKTFYFRHNYPQTKSNAFKKTIDFFGKQFNRNQLNVKNSLFLNQASRIDRQFYYVYGKEKYKTWFNQKLMLSPTIRLSARNLLQSLLYRYQTKMNTSKKKIQNRRILKEVLLRFQQLKYKRFISVREAIFNDFMDRVSSVDDYFVDKHITPELFMIRNYGVKVFLKRDWWRFFDSSHFIVWLARKPWVSWEVEDNVKATLRWFNNNTVYFRFV